MKQIFVLVLSILFATILFFPSSIARQLAQAEESAPYVRGGPYRTPGIPGRRSCSPYSRSCNKSPKPNKPIKPSPPPKPAGGN